MTRKAPLGFQVSISARDDGTVEAMYIRFSSHRVFQTREIQQDVLLADYDRKGQVVGVEIIAPIRIATLLKAVERDRRKPLQHLLSTAAPSDLLLAG